MVEPRSQFLGLLHEAEDRCVPLDVSLELTHRCSFRCRHCYIPNLGARDAVSTDRWLRLLEELAEMGTLFLTLTGGEILVHRDWLVVARRARRLGFSVRLFTNGALIDDEAADAIRSLSAAVEVSLYSMDPQVFERITGRQGSLARTLRGIELLRQREVEIKVKLPVMTYNLSGVEDVFRFAERIGAECRSDPRIIHRKDGNLGPTALQVPQCELVGFYGGPYSSFESPQQAADRPRRDGVLCAAGTRIANISASGDVLACNVLPESAGNINELPFRQIWESSAWFDRLRKIRRRHLKVCDTCSRFLYCKRCAAQALVEDGDLLGPSRWSCEHAEALEAAFEDPR